MSFICGFSGNQEDDLEDLCILPSTPQRKTTKRSNKDSKNPYSNRGLDKFEALLADLDEKRQMIYTRKGSEDISLVRFTYSSSNDVKPIVVKVKKHKKPDKDHIHHPKVEDSKPPVLASPSVGCDICDNYGQLKRKFVEWWRPWYNLPFFVILILLVLMFFDRSFAILFTSVGWYMVPTINGTSEITKRPKNTSKKEYSRKLSEKMITQK